jgi:hypothetical protein
MEGGPFAIEAGELALRKADSPKGDNLFDRIRKAIFGL